MNKEKEASSAAAEEARAHRECSEQKEVEACAALEGAKKDLQVALVEKAKLQRRHLEDVEKLRLADNKVGAGEKKLEDSEAARAVSESLVESLTNNILWMQQHGVVNISSPLLFKSLCLDSHPVLLLLQITNSILNSVELDGAMAKLMVTARHDGYAQGYAECAHHVTHALDIQWDTIRASTHGVDTEAAFSQAKREPSSTSDDGSSERVAPA